jgi:hypothetical protein
MILMALGFLVFVAILWYKVRTHSSFPVIFGLGLIATAYFDILKLFIQGINLVSNLNFDNQFSNMEFYLFSVFIIIILGIYYFSPTRLQRNIIKNTINQNGDIAQEGKSNFVNKVDNTSGKIRQKSE